MQLAQQLYERGLITYMRTDSVVLSAEFCTAVREWLQQNDPHNVRSGWLSIAVAKRLRRLMKRFGPTDLTRPSAQLQEQLNADQFQLYLLIWKRAVASQCKAAVPAQKSNHYPVGSNSVASQGSGARVCRIHPLLA